MERYLYIVGTLGFTLYGQIMMKSRASAHTADAGKGGRLDYVLSMFSDIGVLSGLAAGVLAAVCWMMAVQKLSLSVAYPFMALSFVFVPLTAALVLGEKMSLGQIVGAALIVAGVTISTVMQGGGNGAV